MKYFIILILVFLIQNSLKSQNFVSREYDISYSRDTNNIDHVLNETAYLFTKSNQFTVYSTENFLKRDTLFASISKGEISRYDVIGNPAYMHVTYFPYFVSHDLQKDITKVYEANGLDYYFYEIDQKLVWNIGGDKKDSVNGFFCSTASTTFAGREYKAWFTSEIPINSGPHIFNGLPGLIVRIYDTKKHYIFTIKSVEEFRGNLTSIPFFEKKAIESNHKTVFSLREKTRINPLHSLQSSYGFDFSSNTELKNKIKANAAAKNNPLELRVD